MSESVVVEYFFELSSPYSYFAATQIDALAARTGARVVWKPVVLGAIFEAAGNVMPSTVPAKARYLFADLTRWAAHYDEPFQWPGAFPINAVYAHRAILVVEREHGEAAAKALTLAMYRRYWGAGEDISDPANMAALIRAAGHDVDRITSGMQDPEIKGLLKQYTTQAIEYGVFGAPSFVVDGELFWGNDRLDFLEQKIAALMASSPHP